MSKQFDRSKLQRILFLSKNKDINRLHFGMTIRFASSSTNNGLDKNFGCELSPLNPVCSIDNGALKFCHVVHEVEASCDACHLIFIEGSRCSPHVHNSPSSVFNLSCYNSSDEWLRLIILK